MSDKNRTLNIMRVWHKSLGVLAPTHHRLGNTTMLRFNYHFALIGSYLGSLILVFVYSQPSEAADPELWPSHNTQTDIIGGQSQPHFRSSPATYNRTYPLTPPLYFGGVHTFRIGLIADLDQASAKHGTKNTWRSYYKRGHLVWTPASRGISLRFDEAEPTELTNHYALNGRGMELSELVTFNGMLLTVDDRTGIVYEMLDSGRFVVPWVVLTYGDGRSPAEGFKSEWATVKDDRLWVGSMGKERTSPTGEFESFDRMWVKVISPNGKIHHVNWTENYKKIRAALGIHWPGYMIHESGVWSEIRRKWYFLPRRCSKEEYDETKDEHNGCNVLISADENFESIDVVKLGDFKPTHGFSSMKFIPGTDDRIILALLTEEVDDETSTFVICLDTEGTTLLAQQQVPTQFKFEGVEFI